MSDPYNIKGVTITPQSGGYYDLTHPSLSEPVRERGKEKAEQRAEEIAAAAAPADDDSHIDPQGQLPDDIEGFDPAMLASGSEDPAVAAILQQNALLVEQLAAVTARVEELAAAGVRTVGHTEGAESAPPVRGPSTYRGEMDPETRKRLEEKGHKVLKIILEESEQIPPTGLFISHNGRPYMIQPGVPVDVPDFLVGVLNNAVMSAPIVQADTKKVVGYRDRLKYAYRQVE